MLSLVRRLKYSASHIRTSSWHYHLTSLIWKSRLKKTKACTYYWVLLPSSAMIAGVLLIIMGILFAIGWFVGFQMIVRTPKKPNAYYASSRLFYPYKISPEGEKQRFAPWEIVGLPIAAYGLYWAFVIETWFGLTILGCLAVTILIGFIFVLFRMGWKLPSVKRVGHGLVLVWDRLCPPLVVEEPEESSS